MLQWFLRSVLKTDQTRYIRKNLILHDLIDSEKDDDSKGSQDKQVKEVSVHQQLKAVQ